MMEEFSKYLGKLQATILYTETDDNVGQLCTCAKEAAVYCCVDCSLPYVLCHSCVIESHSSDPFHCIQKWNGSFFDCVSLFELGHCGKACPNHLPGSTGCATKVIHSNGIHEICIEYCHCIHALSEPEKLARSSLFSATLDRPETVFTFAVLKQFHLLGSTAKTSAYDFFNTLVNMTDNTFPKKVPVSTCSRQFQFNWYQKFRIVIRSSSVWSMSGVISQPFAEVDRRMGLTDCLVSITPILWLFAVLPVWNQVSM